MLNFIKNINYLEFKVKLYILLCNIILWVPLDQWTKKLAYDNLRYKPHINYLDGMIKLIYAENRGAWGSLGGTWPEWARFSFLIIIPLFILFILAGYMLFSSKIKKLETWAMSLIIVGGIGNLIDRILHDYVIDFLWMGFNHQIGTNIFNIADVVIMAGIILLIIQNIFQKETEEASPQTS